MTRRTVMGAAVLVAVLSAAGCASPVTSPGNPAPSGGIATPARTLTSSTMPDVVHFYLDSARRKLTGLGLKDSQVLNAALGENSLVIKPSNWIVLTQTPAAGDAITADSVVHLGVVKLNDPKAKGITPRS